MCRNELTDDAVPPGGIGVPLLGVPALVPRLNRHQVGPSAPESERRPVRDVLVLVRVDQQHWKVQFGSPGDPVEASQVQWLAFRDAQIAFINSCYDQYEGTMYQPMRASAIMEVTRARALDLAGRLDMHKEHAADAP